MEEEWERIKVTITRAAETTIGFRENRENNGLTTKEEEREKEREKYKEERIKAGTTCRKKQEWVEQTFRN